MFDQDRPTNASIISQLVPGFGYYDRLGDGLAESLLNGVEAILGLFARLRR